MKGGKEPQLLHSSKSRVFLGAPSAAPRGTNNTWQTQAPFHICSTRSQLFRNMVWAPHWRRRQANDFYLLGHEEENQKKLVVRPLYISFSKCLDPPFTPSITVETYRQHVLRQLFKVFRHRHHDERTGNAQVASACTQAAALMETYRSIRKGYLDYHGTKEVASGMAEEAPAWLAARLDLMLKQDATLKQDKDLKKTVKWCRDACLAMQQMLSQRAFSEFVEKPSSPSNAFNNLLEASQPGDGAHTERVTQFLLAKCRDERTEPAAQNHVWAALSIGMVEKFFMEQLRCGVSAQQETEEGLSLIKAFLTLSWGDLSAAELTASHDLLMDCVEKIDASRLLTDSDKDRLKKNCLTIAHPQFQPFWPFYTDPLYYDEALLAMYSMPQPDTEQTEQGGAPDSPPQNPQGPNDTNEQEEPSPRASPRTRSGDGKPPQEEAQPPTSPVDTKPATPDKEHPQGAGGDQPTPASPEEDPTQPATTNEGPTQDASSEKPPPTQPEDTQPANSATPEEDHWQGAGDEKPGQRSAVPPPDDSGVGQPSSPSPPAEVELRPEHEEPEKPPMILIPVPLPEPEHGEPSEPKVPPSPRVSLPRPLPEDEPSRPSDKSPPVIVVPEPKKKGEGKASKEDERPKSPSLSPKVMPKRIRVGSAKSRAEKDDEKPGPPIERRPSDQYKRQPQQVPKLRPKYVYGHRVMVTSERPTEGAHVHHYEQGDGARMKLRQCCS
ncbi:hypothetical protein ACSSS7_005377 [Eimeria intestinalis]